MPETPEAGDGRFGRPEGSSCLPPEPDPDDITASLLGRPRSLARRQVSSGAQVSMLSARTFWQALDFPLVDTDDQLFTEADLAALRIVAEIVRQGELDEAAALQLTRAFARTADPHGPTADPEEPT